MRMAELAERSGCTVATIKYYQREGLLSAAQATSATQAIYGDEHVERLRLIRILREVGGLPVARVREVVAAIEDTGRSLSVVLRTAHHALGPEPAEVADDDDELLTARREMVHYLKGRHWRVDPAAPSFDVLAGALVALRRFGHDCRGDIFDRYADVAFTMAEAELAGVDPSAGRTDTVTQVIVGTVVFEQALVALRRLAEEHHSRQRFGLRSV